MPHNYMLVIKVMRLMTLVKEDHEGREQCKDYVC